MSDLGSALRLAVGLLLGPDPEVYDAALLSLWVSGAATALAALAGVPIGAAAGLGPPSAWKKAAVTLLNTSLAVPTVLIGLVLTLLLSRKGPLGPLGLLFTPWAMVLGQAALAAPIVAALTAAAVGGADPRVDKTALTLGAGRLRRLATLVSEARFAVLAGVVAAFGRVVGEVGAAMLLGGNIRHYTRTLSTSIVLETSKGEFATGIALGLILLAVALGTNAAFQVLREAGLGAGGGGS